MNNISTKNVLSDINNYNDNINVNVCVLFLRYVGVVHELITSIMDNIHIKNHEYLKYILIKGIKNTTYIYTFLLLYTKNIELTMYHVEKSILYYVEFVGQISQDVNDYLKLSTTDATLFIYKRTIFDIDCEFRKNYIETDETKNIINSLHQYIDIYNTIIMLYVNTFDLDAYTICDLQKNIITKLYKTTELLIQIPLFCKNTNTSQTDVIERLNLMLYEIHKFHDYKFIKNEYLSVINCIIRKFLTKSINIDGFINKINDINFEERIKNMSTIRVANYLTL